MDNRNTPDKLERRIRKALRRATSASLKATSERAMKRHVRRQSEARKALIRMDFDAFRFGAEPAQ